MTPARLTAARLRQLAAELPDRHTAAVLHLSRGRVLHGGHLDRLLHHPGTSARTAERARQRAMTHLQRLGLVTVLDRRIGGIRSGSSGYVHMLTTAGYKLAAVLTGQPQQARRFRAPGPMFIAHALDIAEIYVRLTEISCQTGDFTVTAFVTEPATWWPIGNGGGYLRPDAYTALAVASHRDVWWLEIDRDTESARRLRAKFSDYLDHATYSGTGPDDAPPRVLVTAPGPRRCAVISDLITGLPPPAADLFAVCQHSDAARYLTKALHNT